MGKIAGVIASCIDKSRECTPDVLIETKVKKFHNSMKHSAEYTQNEELHS